MQQSAQAVARLQRAQHALVRVVLQQHSRARSTPLMEQLHWLPIEWRIRFKLATLTYKALHTGRPPYFADFIQRHINPKSTRSSSSQLLFVPRHNLSFGSRAFRVSAPKVWNILPLHIRQLQSLSAFRHHLKTHYFQLAYPAFTNAPWFCSFRLWRFISHLLTYLRVVSEWCISFVAVRCAVSSVGCTFLPAYSYLLTHT